MFHLSLARTVYLAALAAVFVLYVAYVTLASVRQNVGARLFQQKQYAEAALLYRGLLKWPLPAGLEADTRRRLADTLECLGDTSGSAQERERAGSASARGAKDALAQAARGDLLKRKHQYDEACQAYAQALHLTPRFLAGERASIMAKLTLAHFEAGRPAEALAWAENSLQSKPAEAVRRSMEKMAGVAASGMGDLENAESHYRKSLTLAEASGKPEEVAAALALLASLQYKQGRLAEALAAGRHARDLFVAPARTAYIVEADCLREMGRFDEARAVLAQARQCPGFAQPHVERRIQATLMLGAAWVETRAEQADAALALLEQARAGFVSDGSHPADVWPPAPETMGDEKLLLWCDATEAHALALQGSRQQSRDVRERTLSRLSHFGDDRATLINVFSHLSRAAYLCGDLAESQDLLRRYLDCRPNPIGLPLAFFRLGEIYLRLGETDAAREAFQQAVAPGIDSLDARRAQSRLSELGG